MRNTNHLFTLLPQGQTGLHLIFLGILIFKSKSSKTIPTSTGTRSTKKKPTMTICFFHSVSWTNNQPFTNSFIISFPFLSNLSVNHPSSSIQTDLDTWNLYFHMKYKTELIYLHFSWRIQEAFHDEPTHLLFTSTYAIYTSRIWIPQTANTTKARYLVLEAKIIV